MHSYCSQHAPGASFYRALRLQSAAALREAPADHSFPWSERHLRCVWADPAWRPASLTSTDGREVVVENPGRWNLEAGPDFLDAVLRIGPGECTLHGDIELHIRPLDWRHHGHAADRRYQRVIAHVTYFEGSLTEADLPASVLQVSLRRALIQIPSFSFDGLDLPAYPFATLAPSPPCATLLKRGSPEQWVELLESAGEERIRLKTERIGQAIAGGNAPQTLYEEIMGALGYKHNRTPFRRVAECLPLERLRQESAGNVIHAYALLTGVAGLLPTRTNPLWDDETRQFVRTLWDFWWKHQAGWHGKVLPREGWVLSNIRPVNHPLRRLMAAANLFAASEPPLEQQLASYSESDPFPCILEAVLRQSGQKNYWTHRSGLASPRNPTPSALIGPARAATLLTNVIVPWLAATTGLIPGRVRLRTLPPEDENRFARHTAHALFGHDHNPALFRHGLRQQGLLQIFHDFCLNSRNGCRECRLPEALKEGIKGLRG